MRKCSGHERKHKSVVLGLQVYIASLVKDTSTDAVYLVVSTNVMPLITSMSVSIRVFQEGDARSEKGH